MPRKAVRTSGSVSKYPVVIFGGSKGFVLRSLMLPRSVCCKRVTNNVRMCASSFASTIFLSIASS